MKTNENKGKPYENQGKQRRTNENKGKPQENKGQHMKTNLEGVHLSPLYKVTSQISTKTAHGLATSTSGIGRRGRNECVCASWLSGKSVRAKYTAT